MTHYNKQLIINCKKTQSLIVKIIELVENNKPYSQILHHNLAAIGLLKSVNKLILREHIKNCLDNMPTKKTYKRKNELLNEIINLLK